MAIEHVSAALWAIASVLIAGSALAAGAAAPLPAGPAPKALEFPHFPDAMHAFVWRNWSVVEPARLAAVLGTSVENVAAVAASMGLPPATPIPPEQAARMYVTVIRRNWHLVPYEQLLALLGMSADELATTLREDDFLFAKMGSLKPACPPLRYAPPSEEARRRAAEVGRVVRETFGDALAEPGEPRFAFIEAFRRADPPPAGRAAEAAPGLRFIYSYFALYGDPLAHPELDPYPDGLLRRLSDLGVNGVWMHTVLSTLAPSATFPEFGAGHEERLANLRRLVERAKRYGISVYLYMNEPRAMPAAFFKDRPGVQGVQEGDHWALCTSAPEVRAWLSDSLAHVFRSVPDLGGVFTITASENLTNCASHGGQAGCPRCKGRPAAEIVAEASAAVEAGVHRARPDAKVIVWDWGWGDWAGDAIARLPKSVWFMSVSEWSKPITRGGVATAVGEYSLSAVGPGPRATAHWALARKAGLRTVAKVQVNNTWELSAVPYLPVLDLVAEHASNLAAAGIDGLMLSWSLGGYPSPNLEVVRQFSRRPRPSIDAALDAVARSRFGPEGAPAARKAWTAFSTAFREFPFDVGVLYQAPMQYGPSNLLFAAPTGYRATMTGFPYDDLDAWRGPYPAAVFADQFAKVAEGWKAGLADLERAARAAPADRAADAQAELRFAEAAWLHFRSTANQVRFVMARSALLAKDQPPQGETRKALVREMRGVVQDEIETARRLYVLAKQDSRIGYEASNHYFYLPVDLVEKVLNCRHLLAGPLAEEE